ncbi:MAG: hypothetical protein AB7N76_07880 [Planctomycetota bacterium]
MSEGDETPGLADILARGFTMPLVCLVALVGIAVGYARFQAERDSIRPRDPVELPASPGEPGDSPAPDASPAETGPGTGTGSGDVSPREVEDALREGRYADALRLARALGNSALLERANLLHALTRTIEPGPFVAAKTIVRLEGPSGTVTGLLEQDASGLRVQQLDGRERSLPKSALASKVELTGEDKRSALQEQLEAARRALGAEAGGLALHRLAYLAFSAELRPLGARFLEEALKGREGSILVDMFGEGDFERLHRAQRLIAGQLEEPVAVAMRPTEPVPVEPAPSEPQPTAEPSEPTEQPTEPQPQPTVTTKTRRQGEYVVTETTRPKSEGGDPLFDEPAWKAADNAYRSGLQLYRGTYKLNNRMAAISIKAAQKEFQAAQAKLDTLAERYSEHMELEQRQQELAKLVIDCMKRQRIHD